jgi:hypothetical protein
MFRLVPPPIIRSANNCIYSIWYLSLRYCYLPLTLHSSFYLETALRVSRGNSTHHQERIQLYIQHLVFVTPLLLPAANVTQFILSGNCSTCFGWYLHPSSGAQTTVSTASGICHTVIATCRYSSKHTVNAVWQTPDAAYTVVCAPDDGWRYHPKYVEQFPDKINCVTLAEGSSDGVTNASCCRYICMRSLWWVELPPEACRTVSK